MKRIALCIACFALPHLLLAQQGGKTLVNELVKHWQISKNLSLAVAQAMPEDAYSFKATEAEMSFGEQMNHIALGNTNYCAAASGTKNPLTKGTDNTQATAINNLTAAYDYCIEQLNSMTDADLQTARQSGNSQMTALELFWGGFTHAAHHRGQAEVYLRLKGITPPAYKF
jgi:uncharacterized damage-inducible protein DinB